MMLSAPAPPIAFSMLASVPVPLGTEYVPAPRLIVTAATAAEAS